MLAKLGLSSARADLFCVTAAIVIATASQPATAHQRLI